jgi:hypothetical protein
MHLGKSQRVWALGIEQGVLYYIMYIMSATVRQLSCLGLRHFIMTSLSSKVASSLFMVVNTIRRCKLSSSQPRDPAN